MKTFYRLVLPFFISSVLVTQSCAQQISDNKYNLETVVKDFKNDPDLKNASVSFLAVDIKTGQIISSLNPNLAVAPASTMKLLTSATAFEVLGAEFKFKTKIVAAGKIDTINSVLKGNIIIKGGGDPTLGSKYFFPGKPDKFLTEWTLAVLNNKIKFIEGSVIADSRIYGYDIVPPAWSWEDMGNYFGAGANGLSVFDNEYTLTFNTGTKAGDSCKIVNIKPEINNLIIDNKVRAADINSDNSYIFGAPYSYFRYIRGELPKGKTDYKVRGSMPDPALFAASEFYKKMNIYGIKITGKETTFRNSPELVISDSLPQILIYESVSPSLTEIIKQTNYRSINLFAEHLLCQTGLSGKGSAQTKDAAAYVKSFWKSKGMDTDGMSLNDGSGLSRYNTVTALQMVFMLRYMYKSKNFDKFYETIPVAGKNGTVSGLCKGTFAEGNMHVKSGSIRYVAAFAGYVKTKSGKESAFFIAVNNYNCSSGEARKKLEKVLIALSEYNL